VGILTAATLGRWTGQAVTGFSQLYRSNRTTLRRLLVMGIVIVAVPPLLRYWMERIHLERMPAFSVPIETSIALLAGAFFLAAFGAVMYVVLHFMRHLVEMERNVQIVRTQKRRAVDATEGSVIPMTDEKAWATEQIDMLTRQGILTETDKTEIEELAKEMGMEAAMRARVNKR